MSDNAGCAEVPELEKAQRARLYYKELLEQSHARVAQLCVLAGADPASPPDAWTLHDAIVRLKGERARVVAWLRVTAALSADDAADLIEAGEHAPTPTKEPKT